MAELHFISAPDRDEQYHVGDRVEVFCDHDFNRQRIRDWLEGVVVQVDPKLIAVQFRENVYLTDGWMVPDHVLWYTKTSSHVRIARQRPTKRTRSK